MDSIIPAAVLTVSTLVNNALTSAKTVREVAKQSQDSALKDQISDLYDAIIDIKARVLEIDEENQQLRAQLAQRASVKRTSEFGYYFVASDPDPHCPKCYEGSGKLIHLPASERWSGGIRRVCIECHQPYWELPKNLHPRSARTEYNPYG